MRSERDPEGKRVNMMNDLVKNPTFEARRV